MEKELAKADDQPVANASDDKTESNEIAKPAESERLLKEAKAWKERAQKAEAAQAKSDREKLERDGKLAEALAKADAKNAELLQRMANSALNTKVTEYAKSKGCQSIELLLKAGDRAKLSYDAATDEVSGIEDFVDDVMRNHSLLFSTQKTIAVNAATPGGVIATKKITKLSDIAKPDIDKAWGKALEKAQKR